MNNYNIKVHYLYHSAFAVETKNHFLVFDYFKDSFGADDYTLENGLISKEFLKDKKNILVFSSHSHHDHFNPTILDWDEENPNIKYILSSDIIIKNPKNNYYRISQYEDLLLKDSDLPTEVYVKAYGSTDIGISFLVKVDGITLFHSGDLNWWHWKEDSIEEKKSAEENFKSEIDLLKNESIDIAFFPVDPRLEEFYSLGGEYFIDKIKPKIFLPMHFGNAVDITKSFADKVSSYPTKTIVINHRGEEFNF